VYKFVSVRNMHWCVNLSSVSFGSLRKTGDHALKENELLY